MISIKTLADTFIKYAKCNFNTQKYRIKENLEKI